MALGTCRAEASADDVLVGVSWCAHARPSRLISCTTVADSTSAAWSAGGSFDPGSLSGLRVDLEVAQERAGELALQGLVVLRQEILPLPQLGGHHDEVEQGVDDHHQTERDGDSGIGVPDVLPAGQDEI